MVARILPFFARPGRPGPRGAAERAFLPAALEIVETPASPTVRVSAALISAFLLTAAAWAYVGRVDIVATAPGKVIARERTKVIQPFETGVVRGIEVADGDKVVAGQVLIELDPSLSTADRVRYTDMLTAARLDQARLNGLLDRGGADAFAAVAAAPDLVAAARARLDADWRDEAAKLAQLDHQAAQKRAEQAAVEAQIAKLDAALPLARGRAQIRQEGMKNEFGSKLQFLEAQQQVIEMEHERIVQQRKRDEVRAALAEIAEQRAQAEAQYRHNRLADLAKADREATEALGELAKAERRGELQTLTAPVAGVVQDVTVHTLGGVVTPAQQLLRIVPADGGIEVEAVLANQDIGFAAIGQEAEIKVETFPYTRYGLIHGRIREIARDSIAEPPADAPTTRGSQSLSDEPAALGRPHRLIYTARIALEETSLSVDGRPVDLAPGMAVTAEIKTGRRRVLDYFLSPLRGYAHDSLRER
jgi:hemolysin D